MCSLSKIAILLNIEALVCIKYFFVIWPVGMVGSIVMSMSVCASVCPRGYLQNRTHDLYQIFVHVAYVRGWVSLRHVVDKPHRLSA